ncbi:hypothetical protein HPB49_012103 [Dermacentor silvarum]|uniref:Uncharacterized protein n=1 Tax=Dermacentor silvarum TaxID=543639 RepID=A0ACB8CL26_DERSI|nr:hypothetical protein HPB49_012103 [Dermacentor silvarum]
MSETRDEQDALPSGRGPPDGVRSPRSDGSSDSVFSADGDAILRGAELPGAEQGPPAGEVPTTVTLPPADTVHSPPPSICGTSVSTVQPGSDQVITAAMRRIAEKQQQIMDLLFHPNSKIPNSQRSQIISWLSEIVQECSDVRAIAAHQSGRVDDLRDQLRLERRPASGALPPAAQTDCPIRTYAAAARLGMHMPPPSTLPPPPPAAPGDVPHTIPDLAVPPPQDFAPRRDHDFIMFLTPIAPSAAPARDVAALLKHNIDLVAEGIGDIRPRHTRFGLTVFSNEKESFYRLKSAIERNSVTCTALSIKVAEKRHPHVRLSGVDLDIGAHSLIAAINARNPSLQLSPDTCKVRVSFRERSGNYTHVLEVDAAAFRSLMACGSSPLDTAGEGGLFSPKISQGESDAGHYPSSRVRITTRRSSFLATKIGPCEKNSDCGGGPCLTAMRRPFCKSFDAPTSHWEPPVIYRPNNYTFYAPSYVEE